MVSNLLPDNENEYPEIIRNLQESLKDKGEKAFCEIVDDLIGQFDMFVLMLEALQIHIHRDDEGNAPETATSPSNSPGA